MPLRKKGASHHTLNLIAAFLLGRRIKVKVNQKFSTPRPINGRSPQGSVSANALFCATVEFLQEGELEPDNATNNYTLLQDVNESTMFPGDTLLGDIPNDTCVSFEDNGWDVILDGELSSQAASPLEHVGSDLTPFPESLGQVNYWSHVTEDSDLAFQLNSTIHHQHQAGL